MSLPTLADTMLDFGQLKTPADHGDVLVAPDAPACVAAVRHNQSLLRDWHRIIAGAPLSQWRRKTRVALAGGDDAPIIVVGHQPAFIHPGVWAKHVVARRLADALDGVALNLVVDNDAPRDTVLAVPAVEGDDLVVRHVPYAFIPHGHAYEQIARLDRPAIDCFRRQLQDAMGSRFDKSMLPVFLDGFQSADGQDWVDQAVAGRRATEAALGVTVVDRRVSRSWCSPLLIDMLEHARRFAAAYNQALHFYRDRYRIRGAQRPIPDLQVDDTRCELPVWIYAHADVRRRLFVKRDGDVVRLFADDAQVAEAHVSAFACNERAAALVDGLDGWSLRPRALTLTLWARLLLADLFVHGIGGAKYDRITDEIIKTYYEIEPPRMACVSATLHLGLPDAAAPSVEDALWRVRDVRFNPQRHVAASPSAGELIDARARAIEHAARLRRDRPRDRRARREAFRAIRRANEAIFETESALLRDAEEGVRRAREGEVRASIARGREYFFALYSRDTLEGLLDALPGEREFRL